MESPFEILGIDSDASDAEITRAYRRRVKEVHPDHGGSASEFQAVQTAYARLRGEDGESLDTEGESVAERRPSSQVEYLDYEVLADRRWTLDDDDLFEKAAAADLDPADYGRMVVQPHESLLEAAENRGFAWPYACRGGACANCAVAVVAGELSMPGDHILPSEMLDRNIRLSCNGVPATEELQVVYNLKRRPDLDDLRLPPDRFERAHPPE